MENNEIKVELSESEIAAVSGGENAKIEFGPESNPYYGEPIELTGPYYASSYADGPAYRAAIGWSGLYAINKYPDRAAGYYIRNREGDIGWAPRSSFYYK